MDVNKTEFIAVRLKPAEKVRVMEAANARDLRLSEYIRGAIAVAIATEGARATWRSRYRSRNASSHGDRRRLTRTGNGRQPEPAGDER
jgi:hypothetical protein